MRNWDEKIVFAGEEVSATSRIGACWRVERGRDSWQSPGSHESPQLPTPYAEASWNCRF